MSVPVRSALALALGALLLAQIVPLGAAQISDVPDRFRDANNAPELVVTKTTPGAAVVKGYNDRSFRTANEKFDTLLRDVNADREIPRGAAIVPVTKSLVVRGTLRDADGDAVRVAMQACTGPPLESPRAPLIPPRACL